MSHRKKLVIVGCGMATGKLVEELVLLPEAEHLEITIIGEEPYGTYDRIRLFQLLRGAETEELLINSEQWYDEQHIETYLGEAVLKIDCGSKTVRTSADRDVSYDILVVATGSDPSIPVMQGVDLPGVFTFRNINDALGIIEWLRERSNVVIVGGGLPGLELADVLSSLGKEVVVSHFADCLMEKNLDPDAARTLERHLERKGIVVIKDNIITGLSLNDDGRLSAVLQDKSTIDTECVVINCGILPRKGLAEEAGLATRLGIRVDERLQTSDPHIHALGECIEFGVYTYGRIVPVYEQARVLARVLAGHDARYEHCTAPVTRMKSDIPVAVIGKIEPDEGDEVITYDNPRDLIFKKLIVNNDRLVGAHLVGDDLNADVMGVFHTAGLPVPRRMESLLFPGVRKPGVSSGSFYWPLDVTICDCNGVSCGAVREAIRTVGHDVEQVKEHSRAALSCRICESRVEAIVESTYDAIVIGAGLGGLTAGAKLACEGQRVLVIESHDKVGGYASSFTREGYTFDASLHNMGPLNGTLETIFRNLGLDEKVEFLEFDYFQRVIFPRHDVVIEKGLDRFVAYLVENFPDEREGIEGIIGEMRNVREGFEAIEALTLDGGGDEQVSPMLALKYPQFVELVFSSFDELLEKYVKADELKGLIASLWWYFGLPPSELAAILYSVPGVSYIEYSGGYIKGTSQQLSNGLAEIIVEHGGKIRLDTRVTKILESDGKVDGVLIDEGEVLYADVVLSNAGARNTFMELLEEGVVKKKYAKKIRRLENSLSAVQLYLGLDCTIEALGIKEHSFTAFFTYDHEEAYQKIVDGKYAETFFSCMAYSHFDDSLAPPGKGVIHIFSLDHIKNWEELSPQEYAEKKKVVTEQILAKVEPFIPGLGEHVVVAELGTPMTMRRYTSNPEGAVFGPSQIVTQSGLNRLKPETPIEGLYLVGSSIYPGGGYPSVISSGYRVANTILMQK